MPLVEKFPEDMFKLRPGEKGMYGEFPDLKNAANYFKSLMSADEWEKRREVVARGLYESLIGNPKDPTGKGRFFDEKDIFGWYLFLAEAFTDHPQNYEVFFGSRVVPIFAAIGMNLDRLKAIKGFEGRALRAVGSEKAQPNGPLFEILVAGAYANAGGVVEFRPEEPGQKRTYDFDVTLNGKKWAVECKRMESGEYHEKERMRMRELWKEGCLLLVRAGRSCICEVNFKVELSAVPDDYLLHRASKFDGKALHMWSDDVASGSVATLNLGPLQEELAKTYVLHPSPQFNKLLTGEYLRYDKLITIMGLKLAANPHYIDELNFAVVARWSSLSPIAIEKKARDILKRLAEANEQLPPDIAGVAHIGFDASEADVVERRRYEKIIETAHDFDRESSNLEYIYCHYFAPECSPQELWAMDETVQWIGSAPKGRPLDPGRVLPSNDKGRIGVHWEQAR